MITYADVDLSEFDPSTFAFVEQYIDYAELWEFTKRHWPGQTLAGLPFPPPIPDRPVSCNQLYWPRGASRFAVFHTITTAAKLQQIRARVYSGGGGVLQVADLELSTGNTSVTAPMWLLPARPLQQTDKGQDLYLLTLVDDRFFWWFTGASITVDEGTTTWAQLYSSIATALGITLTVDSVSAAYLKPTGAFTQHYEPLPLLLDAVAASVGQRIVRQPDGTCRAWNAANSQARLVTNLARRDTKQTGGLFDLERARGDLPAVLPENVKVVYPDDGDNPPLVVTVTLSSLALPEYGGLVGFEGSKVFRSSAISDGTNTAELTTLANQLATDFYRWQACRQDYKLNGYPPWVLEGTAEIVEFNHYPGDQSTRLMRPPWNDTDDGRVGHHGAAGSSTNVFYNQTYIYNGGNLYVNNVVVNYVGVNITINNTSTLTILGILIISGPVNITSVLELCYQMIWCISQEGDLGSGFDGLGGVKDYDPELIRPVYIFSENSGNNTFYGWKRPTDYTNDGGPLDTDDGDVFLIVNGASADRTITIAHEDTEEATAGRRFHCSGAADIVIPRGGAVLTVYDDTLHRRRVFPFGGGGSDTYKQMVSSNDTTPDYAEAKHIAGAGIAIAVGDEGADEYLEYSVDSSVLRCFYLGEFVYTQFDDAALTVNIEATALPAATCIFHIVAKTTTAWTGGGGLSTITLVVYHDPSGVYWVTGYDLTAAVSNSNFVNSRDAVGGSTYQPRIFTWAASSIRLQVGGNVNLSNLTAGAVKVWAWYSVPPSA